MSRLERKGQDRPIAHVVPEVQHASGPALKRPREPYTTSASPLSTRLEQGGVVARVVLEIGVLDQHHVAAAASEMPRRNGRTLALGCIVCSRTRTRSSAASSFLAISSVRSREPSSMMTNSAHRARGENSHGARPRASLLRRTPPSPRDTTLHHGSSSLRRADGAAACRNGPHPCEFSDGSDVLIEAAIRSSAPTRSPSPFRPSERLLQA